MINLNRLAVTEGASINKILSILADREYLLNEVKFEGYDSENPMIAEELVRNIDFVSETIPKEDKLKNMVIVEIYKERLSVLKAKAKIEKEVYKALGFIRKKFEVVKRLAAEDVYKMCEELYSTEIEDLKLEIFRMLCEITSDNDVINYYNNLLLENKEKKRIKRETLVRLGIVPGIIKTPDRESIEDYDLIMLPTGERINPRTGEIL